MILVAGSANLDFVVRASHIPSPGETVLGQAFQTFPGGKGANQAVACARAGGAPTHMLLALGDDAFAQPIATSLLQSGVVLHTVASAEPTGCAFICVSDDGDNAITVAPGANASLQPQHWPTLDGVSHVLLQLETPLDTVDAYARIAHGAGVQVVLNAAPAQALGARVFYKDEALAGHLEAASVEENDHLAWTSERLHELNGRPSLLNPVWYAGSFAMGLLAARLGKRVSLGFVVATEQQVEAHLASHMTRLDPSDTRSNAIVAHMKQDEARHAKQAQAGGGMALPQPVQAAMRGAATIMTTVAQRI